MPTTTKGYRYPAATQPVSETHTRIQELATDVNDRLPRETRTFTAAGTTDAAGSLTVNLPAGVNATAPTYVDANVNGSGSIIAICSAFGSTTATFTLRNVAAGGGTFNSSAVTLRVHAVWA